MKHLQRMLGWSQRTERGYEKEVNSSISFLDVRITHEQDGSLSTNVYAKPTHTDQYLPFSSHHPKPHKLWVVSTLLKRISTHCSKRVQKFEGKHKVTRYWGRMDIYRHLWLQGYQDHITQEKRRSLLQMGYCMYLLCTGWFLRQYHERWWIYMYRYMCKMMFQNGLTLSEDFCHTHSIVYSTSVE